MLALHAIILPVPGQPWLVHAFFGKGMRSEAAVRSRLLPEHEGANVYLGPQIETRADLSVRFLILIEQVRHDTPKTSGHWFTMEHGHPSLYIAAAMRSLAEPPVFRSSAEGLTAFREVAGVDMSVMAAMMGTERTRIHRLEKGNSKMSFEDYRRLRAWAVRLGLMTEFETCFPVQSLHAADLEPETIPDIPGTITEG